MNYRLQLYFWGMLNKNSILTGVAAGLPFPALAVFMAYAFRYNQYFINKPGLPYFVAIAFNLFLLRYFFKQDEELTCRGIIITTFLFMLIVFLFKIQSIR